MEPRNEQPKKDTEPRKEARKIRFRIVKLEERIAPGCQAGHFNPHGKFVGGNGGCPIHL